MSEQSFPGEHMCDQCYRYVHEHSARNCEADMEGPWECRSYPMHCCRGCGCGSFEEAHPA